MDRTRRNVLILALCQALFVTSNAVVVTSSALAGQLLMPDSGLATLPLGLQFAANMATTLPASFLMQRIGRRAGFAIGAMFGAVAGLIGAIALLWSDFWLFCLGSIVYGVFIGFAMYYRFAAADIAEPAYRPRAISLVLAGGVVAAFAGPELAKATSDLFGPVLFAGCFAAITVLALLNLLVLAGLDVPVPAKEQRRVSGRPLKVIMRQPRFLLALGGGALSQGVMVLIMTAAPLAMAACGLGFADTAFAIQWHIVGMFAPSFFTGILIARIGFLPVMGTGTALMLACLWVHIAATELHQFWVGLVLLGLGWNLTFVGATSLLTMTYEPAETAKVQALNDVTIFGVAAAASLLSGVLHHLIGWNAVNLGFVAPLLIFLAVLVWLQRHLSFREAAQT